MRTIRVHLDYDSNSPAIGSFTYDEDRLPPGVDWVLCPGYRVLEINDAGTPTKIRVQMLGAIDVRQHDLFPLPSMSLAARIRVAFANLLHQLRRRRTAR